MSFLSVDQLSVEVDYLYDQRRIGIGFLYWAFALMVLCHSVGILIRYLDLIDKFVVTLIVSILYQ